MNIVKHVRNLLGMPQARFAEIVGYSQSMISDLELGRRTITLNLLGKLARIARENNIQIDWNKVINDQFDKAA